MGAQKKGARAHLLASFLLAALATQAFLVSARTAPTTETDKATQDDVKKPDCERSSDPHSFPGHGGTTTTRIPSHTSAPISYGVTPVFGTPIGPGPSHGGTTPTAPSHGGGGGHGHGSSPSTGSSPAAPSTGGSPPTTPSHGGGAYGGSPPASGSTTTPSPTGHGTAVDPNNHGTCEYWRSHPMQVWSALGGSRPSSAGLFFNGGGNTGWLGSGVSVQDALANTGTDGRAAQLHDPRGVPIHHAAGQGRLRGGRGGGIVRRRQDQAGGGVQEGQRREQGVRRRCSYHACVCLLFRRVQAVLGSMVWVVLRVGDMWCSTCGLDLYLCTCCNDDDSRL